LNNLHPIIAGARITYLEFVPNDRWIIAGMPEIPPPLI
jgi:hypothetical protein